MVCVSGRCLTSKMANTVDDYFSAMSDQSALGALQRLHQLILEECPEAEDVISYGMPGFRFGKAFIWYAAFKGHCSLFAGTTVAGFLNELTSFRTSKGTIQFDPRQPLPDDLARRIIRQRWIEHLAEMKHRKRS